MIIFTTSGAVLAVAVPGRRDVLEVRGDAESLAALLGSLELAGHAEGQGLEVLEARPGAVVLPSASLALWAQFEILNYSDYPDYLDALEAERGEEWRAIAATVQADTPGLEVQR